MPDREKVIAELANIANCLYPYIGGEQIMACRDAIELLREQEPVEPKSKTTLFRTAGSDGFQEEWRDIHYFCRKCGHTLNKGENNFCGYCGRAVKWNAAD